MSAELRTTLAEVEADAAGCIRCALHAGRTQVVFGAGDPDADLAFAGRAGELLERLLGGIGLTLDDVYLATVLKCRPPGNRDPLPEETAACEPYLYRQLELVQPRVVATLGSFATELLSGRALGITRVHGRPQEVTLAGRAVVLYPLFHPAAALYTPSMLEILERDIARLPELLGPGEVLAEEVLAAEPVRGRETRQPVQLGLF
jgi:DNA polymerase